MSDVLPFQASDIATRLELQHGWQFFPDYSGRLRYTDLNSVTEWRTASVGLSWNAQFEDLRDFMGAAWYRLKIDLPGFQDHRHALLKFGAVDYFCEVYVNGIVAGSHEGGYTPFTIEITSFIHIGRNEIAVRVIDPPMDEAENRRLFPEMMYNEIPHGKQNWYIQNSGIWQGIRLEFRPSIYIDRVDVTPEKNGQFEASIRFAGTGLLADQGKLASETELDLAIYDSAGRQVYHHTEGLGSRSATTIEGWISSPRLWSPDDPHLYMLDACLGGAVSYRRRYRFGFRSFEAREGRFFLNDKPFYIIGALDQDFYPETIHTPASVELVREMMLKAKRLGINVLRCHLKIAHPLYLDAADELGIMIWAEMPSWSDAWFPSDHFSFRAALRAESMFEEALIRDWNHPCLIVHTIMNESWGIDLKDPEQRKWLVDTYDRVKTTMAPLGRLVVDNSACEGNFHLKSDIDDFHQYYSMPDHVKSWDKWLAELASRPAWTFSEYGDAQRTGTEPLMVSEFGNWGLPKLPEDEALPWWFHYSFGGREVTNPSGVFERFRTFKFSPTFRDYNDFAQESQWHQFISLKYEIESIRSHTALQGYVITGMTDVHWEANGLQDMWRNQKVFAEPLSHLQQPDLIMLRAAKFVHCSGDELRGQLVLSHYGESDLAGARLRWNTDSGRSGNIELPNVASGSVVDLGTILWTAPTVTRPTVERVYLELRNKNGARVADNFAEFYVVPSRELPCTVQLHDPTGTYPELPGALTDRLSEQTAILVSTTLDHKTQEHLEDGGNVVLLIDSESSLPESCNISAKVRAGSELDGRWFSNFNWVRAEREPFDQIAFGRILGFESASVVPDYVIQNVPAEHFDDVLAAATFGWLQKTSALAVQLRSGKGRLLATTFRFHEYGADAYATFLLDSLIRYMGKQDDPPRLELTRAERQLTRG